jgi:hypothetical protein
MATARAVVAIQNKRAPADALQVTVVGHEWWWEVRYPDLGIVTANELHVHRDFAILFRGGRKPRRTHADSVGFPEWQVSCRLTSSIDSSVVGPLAPQWASGPPTPRSDCQPVKIPIFEDPGKSNRAVCFREGFEMNLQDWTY